MLFLTAAKVVKTFAVVLSILIFLNLKCYGTDRLVMTAGLAMKKNSGHTLYK
jgi:hypothetical protein